MGYTTLTDTRTLGARVDDPAWVVVDCRFNLADSGAGERAYRESHIPGACYAHLDRDLSSPITAQSGRHPLPDVAALAKRLGEWGIDNTTQVVAYDDAGGAMAVRLWWLLRWLGHEDVAVLDGGWQKWRREGREVTAALPRFQEKDFIPHQDDAQWLSTQQIEAAIATGEILLLDARTPERFAGEQEPIDPIAGHVPGAVNFPLQQNLAADGTFLPAVALYALYEKVLQGKEASAVVHMCGSGVTACHNLLAMEHAGLHGSRLYSGSWSEWIRDPRHLVVKKNSAS
jgi:thiosulfate/3-mercaptopyruvate sulfurtransferase